MLCSDWSLPLPSKNKYRQEFYTHDKSNHGLLNAVQARYILLQSGLPTPVLAEVWNLSDVNKDGALSPDEFCVAMHLIDMYKQGYLLPRELPAELLDLFPNARGTPTAQKATYEDKFMDSYNRSQAELERRRQIAREEEERIRAEAERREKEEQERRERERQELERRRAAELEAERQKELERERLRQEEEAKLRAERDAIRRKLEEERLKELEKIRIRDLETRKESEAEKTAQIQQRHKNMTFQLQALQEKTDSLNTDVGNARNDIIAITAEIEGMRAQRDEKLAVMNQLQHNHQQLSIQCERVSHEHLQLQSECRHSINRVEEIEQLRKTILERQEQVSKFSAELETAKALVADKEKVRDDKHSLFVASNEKYSKLIEEYNDMARRAINVQKVLRQKAADKANKQTATIPGISNNAFNANPAGFETDFTTGFAEDFSKTTISSAVRPFPESNHTGISDGHKGFEPNAVTVTTATIKYRAMYEFEARSDDELSLQPGDVILVFESQNSAEPGWLLGQIKGKVGWFPASFAEPLAASKQSTTPSVVTSPSETLPSIAEEKEEVPSAATVPLVYDVPPAAAELSPPFAKPMPTYDAPPVSSTNVLPMYDAPPIVEKLPTYDSPPTSSAKSLPTYDAPPASTTQTLPTYDAPPGDNMSTEKVIAVGTALYRWNAQKETDLSFAKGDEIEVLEKSEMKWRGRLVKDHSRSGWFPKSYLRISQENGKTDAVSSENQGPISPTTSPSEWYVALWAFDAVEPTDLSIKPGDRIWVIDRQDQWWKGVLNGQTGIFPANYVEKV
uniref:Uncharacterized protein n=1 Tax=Panagrolaimus sp. JU765 TaxID=591449 RepID=A0AC34Q5W0_9BILA